MDFSEINAFLHAAQSQSFTEAARRLGLTPSGVSKSIARLELELGVRLLQRTTRRLNLTPDGAVFLERCVQLLSDLEEMRNMLQRTAAEPIGKLRVSVSLAFGRIVLAPLLAGFCERYPQLIVDVSFTDRKIDLIEDGFDIAVRIGNLPDSRLIARRISTAQLLICASPEYLRRHGRPVCSADLARHSCIGFRSINTNQPRPWSVLEPDGSKSAFVPNARLTVDHGEILIGAALAHAGLVCVHGYMLTGLLEDRKLEVVLRSGPDEDEGIFAVYPSSRHLSPKVRAFIDMLVHDVPASFCDVPP